MFVLIRFWSSRPNCVLPFTMMVWPKTVKVAVGAVATDPSSFPMLPM